MQPWDGKDSLHLFCGSLALALLLDPALPHLVAAFRQDSGLAYSEYRAAFALFVETQHSRLYTTQAAWLTHPHIYTNQSQNFVDTSTKYYLLSTHFLYSQGSQD